jgi:dipeptidyl-peptidase-4
VFLRSGAGDDPANSLWVYDTTTRTEHRVAYAAPLLQGADEALAPEERARRERTREIGGGIVAYACDRAVEHAAFSLGGGLWWVALTGPAPARPTRLPAPAGAFDPRPAPSGKLVAFCAGGSLHAVATSGDAEPFLVAGEDEAGTGEVTWGQAEFVAAEEMGRTRGFWWAPDGGSLLVARVDSSAVSTWWTSDPSAPAKAPEAHRYPAAGTADAVVTLWEVQAVPGGGRRRQVRWDQERYPYVVAAYWSQHGAPLVLVEQRDHKSCAVLAVDREDGTAHELRSATDTAWVAWPPGVPAWAEGGRLVWARADEGCYRLEVDGELVTPPGLQVREVTNAGRSIVFTASSEPEVVEAWEWSPAEGLRQLTRQGGVSWATGAGPARVVVSRTMRWHGLRAAVQMEGEQPEPLADLAETPSVEPAVTFLRLGKRQLSVGVLLPSSHAGGKLPVVMSPYGGPGHQKVVAARSAWLEAQWLADQGFAVVVADGRGTPGRGPVWEREVYLDLAGPVLEDQVDALQAAASVVPELDLGRVGVQGWSFGGYLAALAVLARPDVFHAAFAGAPVTDWRLYDTYYTERFLGHPDAHPEAYERSSLLPLARQPGSARPLMVVHGLSDDNVYAVHTLALSGALFGARRRHCVLPLPGVTHVAAQETVAESLLMTMVSFFQETLRER